MKFYLVAIVFIIFDLELVFLFPLVITSAKLIIWVFNWAIVFLVLLIVGFFFELITGSLDWD